jgi:uncharacterized protein YdaT
MAENRWHVVPRDDGTWAVRREGASRDSARADTKEEAEARAKEIARNQGGGEVIPHGEDGRIQNPDTIAKEDPYPPEDTRH